MTTSQVASLQFKIQNSKFKIDTYTKLQSYVVFLPLPPLLPLPAKTNIFQRKSVLVEAYTHHSMFGTPLKDCGGGFDASDFLQKQRQNIKSDCEQLITPRKIVYSVFDIETQEKLGLSAWTE